MLTAVGAIATGRILCVFGCGGDRDRSKRPLMGEIAVRLSDLAIVTSDNPRTEDAVSIIGQILKGVQRIKSRCYSPADLRNGFKDKGYVVEADRQRAIQLAIRVSEPGDTVLIAGRLLDIPDSGDSTIAFDDRDEARKALGAVVGQ